MAVPSKTIQQLQDMGEKEPRASTIVRVVYEYTAVTYRKQGSDRDVNLKTVVVADQSGSAFVRVFKTELYSKFRVNNVVQMQNITMNDQDVFILNRAQVARMNPTQMILSEEQTANARRVTEYKSVTAVKDARLSTTLSTRGQIVQENGDFGGGKPRRLTIRDDTGSVEINLWGTLRDENLKVGDFVSVTTGKMGAYRGQVKIDINPGMGKIEVAATPSGQEERQLDGLIDISDVHVKLTSHGETFLFPKQLLKDVLDITVQTDDELEDGLIALLPLSMNITHTNNTVSAAEI